MTTRLTPLIVIAFFAANMDPVRAQEFTPALIKGMPRASRSSNAADVQKNPDGSVDIYFGPKAPAGKESNWVPTDPQRSFELMFRAYAPTKALFEKTWKLPDVEKVK